MTDAVLVMVMPAAMERVYLRLGITGDGRLLKGSVERAGQVGDGVVTMVVEYEVCGA